MNGAERAMTETQAAAADASESIQELSATLRRDYWDQGPRDPREQKWSFDARNSGRAQRRKATQEQARLTKKARRK